MRSVGVPADGPGPRAAENEPGLDVEVLRRRRERAVTILAIAAILAITASAAYFALRSKPLDRQAVLEAARRAVQEAVGKGNVFQFGEPVHVEIEASGELLVRGEALAVSSSTLRGRRYWYDCRVHRRPDGSWGPEQLTLIPQ